MCELLLSDRINISIYIAIRYQKSLPHDKLSMQLAWLEDVLFLEKDPSYAVV